MKGGSWIIVVILILVVGGLIYFGLNSNKNTLEDKINACPAYTADASMHIKCITDLAIQYKNDSICDKTGTQADATACTVRAFVAIGDISNCGRLRFCSQDCEAAIVNGTPIPSDRC